MIRRLILSLSVFVPSLALGVPDGRAPAPEPDHFRSTHTGWIHHGCVAFRDDDDLISEGPITWVEVSHGGYIHGLQLGYGNQEGVFHGYKDRDLTATRWAVPRGEHIVKVEGHIAGYYVSRLLFVTDKGTRSPQFGGKTGTPFVASDPEGLPLRTISGHVNLRRHPSLNRACASITFHFSDTAVKKPSYDVPGRVRMGEYRYLQPFYHGKDAYIFGMTPPGSGSAWRRETTYYDNCANWWRINDVPDSGFAAVLVRGPMSGRHSNVTCFQLDGHPHIFAQHNPERTFAFVGPEPAPVIWRINDDPQTGLSVANYKKGQMTGQYLHVVSFLLDGESYILGLHKTLGANIWRVRQEGAAGVTFTLVAYRVKMSPNYSHLAVFYLDEHPYLFGMHVSEGWGKGAGATMWRVVKQPPAAKWQLGLGEPTHAGNFPTTYNFIRPFQLNKRPYVLGVVCADYLKYDGAVDFGDAGHPVTDLIDIVMKMLDRTVEMGKGFGSIWAIEGGGGPSMRKVSVDTRLSHRYRDVITFEKGGRAYIFGVHEEGYANIWRVCDQVERGFTLVYYGRNK